MKKFGIFLVCVVLLVGAIFTLLKRDTLVPGPSAPKPTPTPVSEIEQLRAKESKVEYTPSGFSPQTITIPVNTTILWINTTSQPTSVNSDDYPSNRRYPELNLGTFEKNAAVSLLFTKSGTYTYHNNYNPKHTGKVIVQ